MPDPLWPHRRVQEMIARPCPCPVGPILGRRRLRGDAPRQVILDKLSIAPGDSLVLARSQRQERAERSPFARYALADVSASLQQRSGRSIRCRADGGMLVIDDGRLSIEGYVRPILATLQPTCRNLKKMKSVRNRWMSLPELPPRLRTCLEPLRQVDTLGVIFLEHPARIVSKLVHA